ncbi:hypothetical protein RI129_010816 [Pyrocoelia pectoralis]|uniref:Uncharacterized protein n=1 Tax=Pyrocoelia pectoralis TaxID=417401 RepID=A0AAN7UZK5_9COLE
MTQRIRGCTKNTNLDTVNCDAYRSRLVSRERECSAVHIKRKALNKKSKSALQSTNISKEVVNNTPSVEVTVRPNVRQPVRSESKDRMPWASLLQSSKSIDSLSTFDSCDPLRTVHFLSRELGSKLQSMTFSDPQICDLILTMQHAINRVPTEVTSSNRLENSAYNINDYHKEIPEKLVPERTTISCQTIRSYPIAPATFDKQLEASTAKLQRNCEEMKQAYNNIKKEKEHVENLLRVEVEKVASFRKQNSSLRHENTTITQQRDNLEGQLKCLQLQVNLSNSNELRAHIEELQMQKANLDVENINLRHKLATSDIEKEKHVTLLNIRDRQISEILNEIDSLQRIIKEQLMQLQKVQTVSSASSITTALSDA